MVVPKNGSPADVVHAQEAMGRPAEDEETTDLRSSEIGSPRGVTLQLELDNPDLLKDDRLQDTQAGKRALKEVRHLIIIAAERDGSKETENDYKEKIKTLKTLLVPESETTVLNENGLLSVCLLQKNHTQPSGSADDLILSLIKNGDLAKVENAQFDAYRVPRPCEDTEHPRYERSNLTYLGRALENLSGPSKLRKLRILFNTTDLDPVNKFLEDYHAKLNTLEELTLIGKEPGDGDNEQSPTAAQPAIPTINFHSYTNLTKLALVNVTLDLGNFCETLHKFTRLAELRVIQCRTFGSGSLPTTLRPNKVKALQFELFEDPAATKDTDDAQVLRLLPAFQNLELLVVRVEKMPPPLEQYVPAVAKTLVTLCLDIPTLDDFEAGVYGNSANITPGGELLDEATCLFQDHGGKLAALSRIQVWDKACDAPRIDAVDLALQPYEPQEMVRRTPEYVEKVEALRNAVNENSPLDRALEYAVPTRKID